MAADDVAVLSAELDECRYGAGTTIFRRGELPATVHVVRLGAVQLSRKLNGRRVALQILNPGDVFGDVPFLVRTTEPFDAIAVDDTVLLSIDSVRLSRLLELRPGLSYRWLVSVADRMAQVQARLTDLLAGGMEAQVASFLVRHAERGRVNLSQAVLAELVGGQRTSVNRVLQGLETRGLVRLHYRQVEIVDEKGLLEVCGAGRRPRARRQRPQAAGRLPPGLEDRPPSSPGDRDAGGQGRGWPRMTP